MKHYRDLVLRPAPTVLLLLAVLCSTACAQLVLNEVMADNRSTVANGERFPDYVELWNRSKVTVNLSGLSLTDDLLQPRRFVFPSGTTIPADGHLIVWCSSDPVLPGLRAPFGLSSRGDTVWLMETNGVQVVDSVSFGPQAADFSIGRVAAAPDSWTLVHPSPNAGNSITVTSSQESLRLNEWMARPSTGDDWVELCNLAPHPVSLAGLVLTDRASGSPNNRALPPLSFITARGFLQLLANGSDSPKPDELDFRLGASGETITLYALDRYTRIDQVTFGSQAEDLSQGRVPDGGPTVVTFARGSSTPGASNLDEPQDVVISEVLSHTDPPWEDAIELQNLSTRDADVSHWWLSDSADQPKKYRVPTGTVIPPHGFVVFYEYQFGAGANGFSLNSSSGEVVFLSVGTAVGSLTGERTFVQFGALRNGVSAGRFITSTGFDFVPLEKLSFGVDRPASVIHFRQGKGAANAASQVGPVVISEILFHPAATGVGQEGTEEFLELESIASEAVPLFDPLFPTNTWRLRDGISFNLPTGLVMNPGSRLVVVGFDPTTAPSRVATFRSRHGIPAAVPIFGPCEGKLSDAGDTIELLRPDKPEGPDDPDAGFVPYELVERIVFLSGTPWPRGADGTGASLQRISRTAYGNDPLNWFTALPNPGAANRPDSDGDGMPDAWEHHHSLDWESAHDAVVDHDRDGASNLSEYSTGTDPNDPHSVLRLAVLGHSQAGLRMTFPTVAGFVYRLESRELVLGSSWIQIFHVPPSTGSGRWEEVIPFPAASNALIRVGVRPGP